MLIVVLLLLATVLFCHQHFTLYIHVNYIVTLEGEKIGIVSPFLID